MRTRLLRAFTVVTLVSSFASVARVAEAADSATGGAGGDTLWAGVQTGTPPGGGGVDGGACRWTWATICDSRLGSSTFISKNVGGVNYDLYERMEAMIEPLPIGSEGVVYLPYLSESGIIAPVVDAEARAGFHGLAPRHGRPHMVRAVYEGVVLALRDLYRELEGAGDEILLTGGGARSPMWTQMIADALGARVLVPAGTEFGARGAALLAATAIGRFGSIQEASVSTRAIQRRHEPDTGRKAQWDQAFAGYRKYRDRALG